MKKEYFYSLAGLLLLDISGCVLDRFFLELYSLGVLLGCDTN